MPLDNAPQHRVEKGQVIVDVPMMKEKLKAVLERAGYRVNRIDKNRVEAFEGGPAYDERCTRYADLLTNHQLTKAHYGCGDIFFGKEWANIDCQDLASRPGQTYFRADLTAFHPFPSDVFQFAYAEDFLEHLTQADSLIFLSEAYRCLKPGGVLRLSFPGLKQVLAKHFRESHYHGASLGKAEAFTPYGHHHFYCEESLEITARHIGFSHVAFADYGESNHAELRGLEVRADQKQLNIHVEMTKPE